MLKEKRWERLSKWKEEEHRKRKKSNDRLWEKKQFANAEKKQ